MPLFCDVDIELVDVKTVVLIFLQIINIFEEMLCTLI